MSKKVPKRKAGVSSFKIASLNLSNMHTPTTLHCSPQGLIQPVKELACFTFFLRDESIHDVFALDKDAAMRSLCAKLGRSWAHLHGDILDVLST